MDGFYRGIETSLLALTLILGLAAFTIPSMAPRERHGAGLAVTLPMLSVTAAH